MNTECRTWIVTGFPGWFGSRFLEMLAKRDDRVIAIVHPSQVALAHGLWKSFDPVTTASFECLSMDLATPVETWGALPEVSQAYLVHGAGLIHPKHGTREFQTVNVDGTSRLLSWLEPIRIEQSIFISSNSQAGCNPHPDHRFTEDSPYNPYMGYGASKMGMEMVGGAWATKREVPLTILRPCWFMGPHQPERQGRFYEMVAKGSFPLLGGGGQRRSITFVDDLCQAVFLAAEKRLSGVRTYWIALEEALTMKELVTTVQAVMTDDFQQPVVKKYKSLPSFIGTVAEWVDVCFQRMGIYVTEIHVAGELNKTIACSVERAKRELGFKPTPSLREAVRASYAWYMTHKK